MRIHLRKTYKESFCHMWHHKLEWFRVAFGPLIIYLIALGSLVVFYSAAGVSVGLTEMMTGHVMGTGALNAGGVLVGIGHLIYFILSIIAGYTLMINGYRFAVLGEGGDSWWTLNLNMRFLKIILYLIFISILVGLYSAISGGIVFGLHSLFESVVLNVLVGIGFAILGLYLFFRISLTFLLISVDQLEPLRKSWKLLDGNVWKFFLLAMLILFTLLLIFGVGMGILSLFVALLALGSPVLMMLGVLLTGLFGGAMYLATWATMSKAFGIVYLSLKEGKK